MSSMIFSGPKVTGYLLLGVFMNLLLTALVLYNVQYAAAGAGREQQRQGFQLGMQAEQGLQHMGPFNPQRQEVGFWDEKVKPVVSRTGAWNITADYVYLTDKSLALKLAAFFGKDTPVLELGAGKGHYTVVLEEAGVKVTGYEGASNIEELTNGYIHHADFTERHEFGTFDWVLSLEVGEHIPANYMLQFIDNIDRHNTKGVVLSWAVLGQGGNGHVNCRSNEFIKGLFGALGYTNDLESEAAIRDSAVQPYFKDSIMVFRKE